MVYSWATEVCVDPIVLLPEVRDEFIDFTILDPSERPTGMGNSMVEAGTKGKMTVILINENGRKLNVPIPMLAAPGMRCHVYSVVNASTPEVATYFNEKGVLVMKI